MKIRLPTFDRGQRGAPLQQPHRCNAVDRHPFGRQVEWLTPPLLHYLGYCLGRFFDLLLRIRCLGSGDRHKPVDVRVRQAAY